MHEMLNLDLKGQSLKIGPLEVAAKPLYAIVERRALDTFIAQRTKIEQIRPFLAEVNDFEDHGLGEQGKCLRKQGSLSVAEAVKWTLPQTTPDQITAADHAAACKRLDCSEAGKKARDLLFSHLDEQQLKTAQRDRYFDIRLPPKETIYKDKGRKGILFRRWELFRIYRGFPNGNVKALGHKRSPLMTFCLHPGRPYPTDDIVLTQKLMLETDAREFIALANCTFHFGDQAIALRGYTDE